MLILFYYLFLLLPGYCLVRLLDFDDARYLFTVAISVIVATFSILLVKILGLESGKVVWIWCALTVTVVVLSLVWKRPNRVLVERKKPTGMFPVEALSWGGLIFAMCVYTAVSGPYVEIPSDAIWHVGRISDHYEELQNGNLLRSFSSLSHLVSKSHGYWYIVQANIIYWSGYSIEDALYWINISHTVILILTFYQFCQVILTSIGIKHGEAIFVSLVASFFFFLHFGLGVFSFVRYYTFGPVFLNLCLYFSGVVAVLRYLQLSSYFNRWALYLVIVVIGMTLIHKQEALFLIVVALTMIGIAAIRHRSSRSLTELIRSKTMILAACVAAGYLLTHGYLYTNVVRNHPLSQGLLTDINVILPFLKNLYVLRPDLQFYQVVTIWGLLVYSFYYWKGHVLRRNLYISAGMLLPFVTVFNPVFTDLFLRLSYPEVLWRLCYVIPLHLVAAWFFVRGAKLVWESSIGQKVKGGAVCASLLILLLPFQNHYIANANSKTTMLKPVSAGNDWRVWSELIDQLRKQPKTLVLSDPITGYTLNAFTDHMFPSHKFSGKGVISVGHQKYEEGDFRPYRGWLLVINNRSGNLSEIGRLGRHWSKNAMRPVLFYDGTLREFVEENPQTFALIWESEDQWIYRVK